MSSFHGEVGTDYLAKAADIFLPLKQLSYERMNASSGNKILDVGCGSGVDVMALAKHVGETGKVIGFDHDAKMLDEASQKVKNIGLNELVSVIQGSATQLPFQADYFDSCRSERLFMHLIEPEQVLSEMIRVTKPGGRIVILDTDWCSLSIDTLLPNIERALSDYRLAHVINNGYSGRSLYRQFREQQLSDIQVEVFPIFFTDIDLFYFICMQQAIEDQALADHAVTRKELNYWRTEMEQAASNDSFYGCANIVMVSATKPVSA